VIPLLTVSTSISTGKTYTLLGDGRGLDLVALASNNSINDAIINAQNDNSDFVVSESEDSAPSLDPHSSHLNPRHHPETTRGMIPKLVGNLFELLYQSTPTDSSIEYTVRCSYVEIYLEKMTDLLHPRGEVSGLRIGQTILDKSDDDACILGAVELCCLCPADVYALLARGQARRTKSADDASVDSSRSYAVFTLNLEQTDIVTGQVTRSRLQAIDCAGSESKQISKTVDTAIATQGNMINASLKSLHNVVSWTLQQQETPSKTDDELPSSSLSKIANLMKPSFGGRTHTVMICTGAPSSYSIDETIQAIRFAQLVRKIRNRPRPASENYSFQLYQSKLLHAKRREEQLTQLIVMMAQESKHGKKKTREPKNPKVWEAILQICDADKKKQKKNGSDSKKKKKKDKDGDGDLCISLFSESEQQAEIQELYSRIIEIESKFQQERTARQKAEAKNRDVRSEFAALKYQNESLLREKRKLEAQLNDVKAEAKSIYLQKAEVEHRLRTSEFRESEAVLFLRQLRTFYCRLLKNKAAQGNGSTREIIQEAKKRIPGVADLEDLLDVDKMMVQSGIIESSEVGGDTLVSDYSPSSEALSKSSIEAEMAEKREMEIIHQQLEEDNGIPRTTQDIVSDNKDQKLLPMVN
jgi:kinesin family protein 5